MTVEGLSYRPPRGAGRVYVSSAALRQTWMRVNPREASPCNDGQLGEERMCS